MIICDQPPIAYFPPTKTGTTTVEHMLADQGIPITVGRALKHDMADPEVVADLDKDGYFFMITLRNPYSRAVSMWSHFHRELEQTGIHTVVAKSPLQLASEGLTFARWVDKVLLSEHNGLRYASYFRAQADYLAAMPRIDAKLRQETLVRDLLNLPFIDKEKWRVRHERVGVYRRNSHWRRVYGDDPGLIAAVKSRFEADFEAAGYSPNFEDAT